MKEINQDFFKRDTLIVARDLLGKILEIDGNKFRIIETEAYKQDKASHARKKTNRSKLMFETHGYVYVYLIYGMYYCLNFTSDIKPGAVLIRAIYPLNKKLFPASSFFGPGKLCKQLNITKLDNGKKIGERIKLFDDDFKPKINKSERIGIKDDKHLLWRFFYIIK